ncbi:hypothetical protein [Pyxidicoccus sp. MSG2]|nr:hypothetical protein [Pyxidicoccus sp. MSG2]MCY1015699.1 hypothetical protein [Pyxidicoccus sp. MSG2]
MVVVVVVVVVVDDGAVVGRTEAEDRCPSPIAMLPWRPLMKWKAG